MDRGYLLKKIELKAGGGFYFTDTNYKEYDGRIVGF
jgi:hypothetical protein